MLLNDAIIFSSPFERTNAMQGLVKYMKAESCFR